MERNNDEKKLLEKLSKGPTSSPGFSKKLESRIEEKIGKENRMRRSWIFLAGRVAVLVVILIFSFNFKLVGDNWNPSPAPEPDNAEPAATGVVEIAEPAPLRDALLLGLRKDERFEKGTSSTYRTLLVAPVAGSLEVAARGSGILLPYKQEFWKIETATRNTEDGRGIMRYLTAYPAEQKESAGPGTGRNRPLPVHDGPLVRSEALTFVGNKYVSVQTTDYTAQEAGSYRVNTVLQLRPADPEQTPELRPNSPTPFVSLSGLLGVKDPVSDVNWAIVRAKGKWIAMAQNGSGGPASSIPYRYAEVPVRLSETVVSHDKLAVPWEDVERLQPGAKDAVSSPDRDLLAVVTDNEIRFYKLRPSPGSDGPERFQPLPEPLLTVPLRKGETLIMAQWATGIYVPQWIDKTRKYLDGND